MISVGGMGEKAEVPVALDHGLTLAFFSCIGFTVYALSSDRESLLIFAGLLVATVSCSLPMQFYSLPLIHL